MASGKSGLGRELAGALGYGFTDTDDLFEERYRISINDFFGKYGEEVFRRLEKDILQETIQLNNAVIATGGGTPCFFDNMEVIRRAGLVIYLEMDAANLAGRLSQVRRKRPLLKDIPPAELPGKVEAQLAERDPIYRRADIIISADRPDLVKLVSAIRSRVGNR